MKKLMTLFVVALILTFCSSVFAEDDYLVKAAKGVTQNAIKAVDNEDALYGIGVSKMGQLTPFTERQVKVLMLYQNQRLIDQNKKIIELLETIAGKVKN
jgi:hypothetical protein